MKKAFICVLFATSVMITFGQEIQTAPVPVSTDYLQKSKNQKTAAWILVGSGSVMIAIAAFADVSFDILPVLAVGGSLSTLGSIPLFIASARNKRKALKASASFKTETSSVIRHAGFARSSYPAFSIKICL